MELGAPSAHGQGFCLKCDSYGDRQHDETITEAIEDSNFLRSSNHLDDDLDHELDLVFKRSEQTQNTSSSDLIRRAQTDSGTKRNCDQICSDLAYQHVLKEFGLADGASLHESTKLVRAWQVQFNILRGRTKN